MTVAVVFDLDGVVWDLRPHIAGVLGLPADLVHRYLVGGGNVLHLTRGCGVSAEQFGHALAERDGILVPNVLVTLDSLATAGCHLAAATGLSSRIAGPIATATGLADRLERIITPGRGLRSKPAPDSLHAAAAGSNAAVHWYVGDSPKDQRAAAAAGWCFVWSSYGYGPRPDDVTAEIAEFDQLPMVLGV
jgi:phosphoglycolate phosphatase-like HAD superfamily hydrolase